MASFTAYQETQKQLFHITYLTGLYYLQAALTILPYALTTSG